MYPRNFDEPIAVKADVLFYWKMKKQIDRLKFAFFALGLLLLLVVNATAAAPTKYNVLLIAIDDLRPELGCYGNSIIKTPNIDALARRGLMFNRAYVQQAVCSPSRTVLMTGRRPDTTKVYDLETHFRDTIPNVVTVSQYLMQHGYHAQGLSKIYHGNLDDKKSWSEPHWTPNAPRYSPEGEKILEEVKKEQRKKGVKDLSKAKGPPWEAPEVEDNALADGKTADRAVELLGELKGKQKPFFLAVGFLKPHLPFVAPKKYWDLYDPNLIEPAPNPFPPTNSPSFALTDWGELRTYVGMPKNGPLSEKQAREAKHGYYAAVSYADAQIGRVLNELDKLGLRDNTVVVLWGDHGWQLGEHGFWCKHTNFEIATRIPLIVSVPKQRSAGKSTDALVETVDVYPTLVELCGLPLPEGLEGTSVAPLIQDPKRPWKKAAFSQYPRNIPEVGRSMGYSMRTDRFRLTQWAVPEKQYVKYELYDHKVDPQENNNVANDPDYQRALKQLIAQLKSGWKETVPRSRKP
jgi:iduronate 2-sulfatase